ncbi:MAG TPA: alpha/beta fold hydrolase [Actinotalea sp.]|jgi:pimeloyl-ACP methyl ester carboxylesterase
MHTFRRGDLVFDVRDSGPSDGEAVVCLHGFPQDGSAYDAVTPLLVAEGMRVLAPDQRGYSPGARPAGRRPYVLRELVADVVALLDQAGVEKAHVVGHDWGGGVAWTFASRHEERTLSLTAVSTPHPAAMTDAMKHSDQLRRSSYMLAFQVPRVPEAQMLADGGAKLRRQLREADLPAALVDKYVTRLLQPGALTAALAWYRALPFGGRYGAGVVRVPTVYLYGARDPFFSPYAEHATPRYVRAPIRTVVVDTGHWVPESHPQDVAAAVLSLRG